MTKQFRYTKTKELDPKPGNKFFTVYYQMHPSEHVKLMEFVQSVAAELMAQMERSKEDREYITAPLKGFKRTNGLENYSIEQILIDTLGQLQEGKDLSKGMLGRWNKVFADTPYDFDLVMGTPYASPTAVTTDRLKQLFLGV